MTDRQGSLRSSHTSRDYIRRLEDQLKEERRAREDLQKEVHDIKQLNSEISSKMTKLSKAGLIQL